MGGVKKDILKPDSKLQEACEELRIHVDNINKSPIISLRGDTFKSHEANLIHTIKVDGIEIGYRLQDFNTFLRRQVFIKVPGYKIIDLSKGQRSQILTSLFNVFLVVGADTPEIANIAPDCMLIQQNVVMMVLKEKSPGLVSIAGGSDNALQ